VVLRLGDMGEPVGIIENGIKNIASCKDEGKQENLNIRCKRLM
jgi:hypothetical protein